MSEHGAPHHADNPQQKRIGIFISVLAVLMAIVSSLANNASNEMIVKQVEASNGFSWYQSKRQRSYMNELEIARIDRELAGTPNEVQKKQLDATRAKLQAKNSEYEKENDKIRSDSEADKAVAVVASHRHHWFEFAEVALHIAVVLCSLTLLTDSKLFLQIGVIATILGLLFAGSGLLVNSHDHPPASAETAPAGGHH